MPIYQLYEGPADIGVTYVNHAHNDLLELWLETGVVGPLLVLLAAIWIVRRSIVLWRPMEPLVNARDIGLMRAASVMLPLLAIHTLVDYPLRTSAMMGVAAFAAALIIPPRERRHSE